MVAPPGMAGSPLAETNDCFEVPCPRKALEMTARLTTVVAAIAKIEAPRTPRPPFSGKIAFKTQTHHFNRVASAEKPPCLRQNATDTVNAAFPALSRPDFPMPAKMKGRG